MYPWFIDHEDCKGLAKVMFISRLCGRSLFVSLWDPNVQSSLPWGVDATESTFIFEL